jgi:hypothetical protein
MACDNCPLDELNNIDCKRVLFGITRSLIKELQAHNENLKRENKYLRDRLAEEAEIKEDMSVSELKAEIEILSKENETLKITTIDQYSHLCDCHDKIAEMLRQKEADTVKKMQERLKAETITIQDHTGKLGSVVLVGTIDQIAKEILEKTK